MHDHTDKNAILYTDEHSGYDPVRRHRYAVRHSIREYVVAGEIHTNGIESLWAAVKRSRKGTFIKWSRKHSGRYVNECCGRLNMRGLEPMAQVCEVVRGLDGKRLTYKALTNSPVMFNNPKTRPLKPDLKKKIRLRDLKNPEERLTQDERLQIPLCQHE